MAERLKKRMTAEVEGEFVVFLIGMRVNSWWRVHKWFPVFMAMPRMMRELFMNPDSGFLGAESAFGNPTIMVQYWRSFEHLEAYARDPKQEHRPAWADFNRRTANNGHVGVWHETYVVQSGAYECVYNNMPRFGLGKVGTLVPATGARRSAGQRIANTPVPGKVAAGRK